MSKDESFILTWQLLNRLFSGPLESAFIREILQLPVDHMVAAQELAVLMAVLEDWDKDPQIQKAAHLTFQRLFVGPGAPPAPPWGSVYLTADNTIMGPSTLAVRKEFQRLGLSLKTEGWEPDDHFAHCCAFLSLLSQEDDPTPAQEFLKDHFLPWAPRFLELMAETCKDPVYEAIAGYARAVIDLASENLETEPVKLYL